MNVRENKIHYKKTKNAGESINLHKGVGVGGRKVIKTLDVGEEQDDECYKNIITALNNHFMPKLNRVYGMNMLYQI